MIVRFKPLKSSTHWNVLLFLVRAQHRLCHHPQKILLSLAQNFLPLTPLTRRLANLCPYSSNTWRKRAVSRYYSNAGWLTAVSSEEKWAREPSLVRQETGTNGWRVYIHKTGVSVQSEWGSIKHDIVNPSILSLPAFSQYNSVWITSYFGWNVMSGMWYSPSSSLTTAVIRCIELHRDRCVSSTHHSSVSLSVLAG